MEWAGKTQNYTVKPAELDITETDYKYHLGGISTYPCFILYICFNGTRQNLTTI